MNYLVVSFYLYNSISHVLVDLPSTSNVSQLFIELISLLELVK